MQRLVVTLLFTGAAAMLGTAGLAGASDYYVNSAIGSDGNSGTSAASPWQSLNKLDAAALQPGDTVYLADGSNWYGQRLVAADSGTTSDPITYTNYGSGADPTIWGSVPVANTSFQPVAGASGTYFVPAAEITSTWGPNATAPGPAAPLPVGSVFENGNFLRSASLLSASPLSYVEANANTWYYGGAGADTGLYVNAGAPINAASTNTFTASGIAGGQDPYLGVVYSNGQNNVTFKNLNIEQSAAIQGGGYGFSAAGGSNVELINSTVSGAGKHAVAAIDTTGFLAQNVSVSNMMPDQGYGAATAFVAYSDPSSSNDTSVWANDSANMGQNNVYPAFYDHWTASASDPTPIGKITITNMQVQAGGMIGAVDPGAPAGGSATVDGGSIVDGGLSANGNATVNGVVITGPAGQIALNGSNNVVENSIISGAAPNWQGPEYGAIQENGTNDTIRYNTVVLAPANGTLSPALGLGSASSGAQIYANIFSSPGLALYVDGVSTQAISASVFDNLLNSTATGQQLLITYWPRSGGTAATTTLSASIISANLEGRPDFVNAAGGDFSLLPNSIAAVAFDPTTGQYLMYDFYGTVRPLTGESLGAIQVNTPEPACIQFLGLGALGIGTVIRRRASLRS
jgi:hypothetical protein